MPGRVTGVIDHLPPEYRGRPAPRRFAGAFIPQTVQVHDAREMAVAPTIAADGLCCVPHRSAVREWGDAAEAEAVWCREAAELMRRLTGAEEVLMSATLLFRDHRRRADSARTTKQSFYASFAHGDKSVYTEGVAKEEVLARTRGRHFAHYNLWRNIDTDSPVVSDPLALLLPASTETADLIITEDPPTVEDLRATHRGDPVGMKRLGSYAPIRLVAQSGHRWLYWSRLRHDEVLVFRQYDTRITDPRMQQVIHASFPDPTAPPSAPARRSVELRVVCVFGEADPAPEARRRRLHTAYGANRLRWPAWDDAPPAARL